VKFDLLTPGIEVGLVTTNPDPMVAFYEGFLELETYTPPPPQPAAPGGGRAQAGVRYVTIGVQNLRAVAEEFAASPYEIVEPLTEFAPVPGMGWMFVADPDGNWIELFGTL
jgi:catechol 2,3-dioxygenase-like lactoylglutathione lyase family enzyme